MPGYVQFYKWTPQGIANVKGSPGRIKQAEVEAQKLGIQKVGVWVTMGEHDLIGIWDAPNDQAMVAFTLALAKLGNVTTQTMRALSEDEFAQIVEKLP